MSTAVADTQAIEDRIATVPYWYHRIDVVPGVTTPGIHFSAPPQAYKVPEDLTGKRVLDVGAWDGLWTFEALRRGASEVVAIEDHSDRSFIEKEPDRQLAWAGFDLLRDILGYDRHQCQRYSVSVYDVGNYRSKDLGTFDVIFFFGTLYHLRYPLLALDVLSSICDGEIYVESFVTNDIGVYQGGLGHGYGGKTLLAEFYPSDELANNPTNWWGPTLPCVLGMMEAAGFKNSQGWTVVNPPTLSTCRGFAKGDKHE